MNTSNFRPADRNVAIQLLPLLAAALTMAAAGAVSASDAGAGTELDEVVVTAQKRSESLQRAAIPIAVVDAEALAQQGVVTPTSLNASVPAVIVQKAGGANTIFYIRGVGNFTVNAYADPAIAFNVDGVYLGRPTSTTGAFFDLERVEVLKGPQGTLYGRNATGGAINILPVKPSLDGFGGSLSASVGNYSTRDVEGALNAPVGSRSALRVAAKVVSSRGYYKDGTNDEVGQAFRAQWLTHFSDRASLRLAADYSHQGGTGPGASFDGVVSYAPGAPASATSVANYSFAPSNIDHFSGLQSPAARAYSANFTIPGAFNRPGASLYPSIDNKYWGALAEAEFETGVGTVTFIPAYRAAKLDNLFNGPNFAGGIVKEDDRQFSAELRLQGKRVGPLDWLVGAYYFDENISGRYTFSQYQINSFQKFDTGTRSAAAFARLTWNINERLRLVGAARYTRDRKELVSDVQTLVEICSNAPPPTGPGCFANGSGSVPAVATFNDLPVRPVAPGPQNSVAFGTAGNRLFYTPLALAVARTFSQPTYRAAVEFDVAQNSLLYASFETGFRGGGFSNSLGHETYDPEYLDALTLGSKNRFLSNRAQLNVEVFQWKYRNQQVSHFGFDTNGNSSLFTENVGRSTISGVDIDGELLVEKHTLLRGTVQYLKNEFKSFVYTNPRGGTNLPPVTGCAVSNGSQGALLTYVVDCSGLPGFNAPKWSANLALEHSIPLGSNKLVLSANGRYRGDRVTGFERLPQMQSGSDSQYDAFVQYGPADGRWFLGGYVRNLTDEQVRVATQYSGTTGGSVSTIYAAPRTYGLRLGIKY